LLSSVFWFLRSVQSAQEGSCVQSAQERSCVQSAQEGSMQEGSCVQSAQEGSCVQSAPDHKLRSPVTKSEVRDSVRILRPSSEYSLLKITSSAPLSLNQRFLTPSAASVLVASTVCRHLRAARDFPAGD
jgi:hypothetical protein